MALKWYEPGTLRLSLEDWLARIGWSIVGKRSDLVELRKCQFPAECKAFDLVSWKPRKMFNLLWPGAFASDR
jgi:hypothetical protein